MASIAFEENTPLAPDIILSPENRVNTAAYLNFSKLPPILANIFIR